MPLCFVKHMLNPGGNTAEPFKWYSIEIAYSAAHKYVKALEA